MAFAQLQRALDNTGSTGLGAEHSRSTGVSWRSSIGGFQIRPPCRRGEARDEAERSAPSPRPAAVCVRLRRTPDATMRYSETARRRSQLSYFAANDWGRPNAAAGSGCVTRPSSGPPPAPGQALVAQVKEKRAQNTRTGGSKKSWKPRGAAYNRCRSNSLHAGTGPPEGRARSSGLGRFEKIPPHRRVEGIAPSTPGFAGVHWCAEKVIRDHSSAKSDTAIHGCSRFTDSTYNTVHVFVAINNNLY